MLKQFNTLPKTSLILYCKGKFDKMDELNEFITETFMENDGNYSFG